MAEFNVGAAFALAGTVILDVSEDVAQLEAGQTVSTPKVKIGTINGKNLNAAVQLSTD